LYDVILQKTGNNFREESTVTREKAMNSTIGGVAFYTLSSGVTGCDETPKEILQDYQ